MPTRTSHKRDHSSLAAKAAMRQQLLKMLPRPVTVLEAFGGTGELWKHSYDQPGVSGLVIEQHPKKAEILASQRPHWIVVEGDCTTLLAHGLCRWMPFDLLDLDAHGSPLMALASLADTPRPWPASLWIVATDGVGFAIRRGSIPALLQPFLHQYGRHVLLRDYPTILQAFLTAWAARLDRRVTHFRWRVAGSAGQLYHWICRVERHDSEH